MIAWDEPLILSLSEDEPLWPGNPPPASDKTFPAPVKLLPAATKSLPAPVKPVPAATKTLPAPVKPLPAR